MTDRTSKQKITKNGRGLESASHELDRIDIFQIRHPTVAEYTLFFTTHGIFIKINYVLGYKTIPHIFMRAGILLTDHKIEITIQ